jgi:hypothetical protein
MFVISVFNIGGAWSAKLGHGKYGTFTAEYEFGSGKGRPDWFGTFVADDGTDQRRVRIDGSISRKGQQVRVIDPGGGPSTG